MPVLNPGDTFPTLTVALPEGASLQLPGHLAGHFGVVLFYRGAWCPYCNAQLRAFQRAQATLADVDARVYSSGAIGRLVPEDVVGLIGYVRQHAA